MRKKVLTMMLVVVMCIANVLPVFAAEVDPAVQKFYDAYLVLVEAFNSETKDLEALKSALVAYEENELDMEQSEEFYELVDFTEWFLCTVGATNVIEAENYYIAFVNDKNAKTASDLVDYYEMATSEEYEEYGLNEAFAAWLPELEAAYEEAKTMLPSENVKAFYEAFTEVQTQLEGTIDSLREAVEACDIDLFNDFTAEERAELATLMEVADWEEAFNVVLSDWIDANIILEVEDAYNAYTGSWSAEDAGAFVEKMDQVSEMYDGDLSFLEYYFGDLSGAYEEAKEIAEAGGSADDTESEDEAEVEEPEDTKEKAAKTGDSAPVIPMMVLFAGAAVVLATQKKRTA